MFWLIIIAVIVIFFIIRYIVERPPTEEELAARWAKEYVWTQDGNEGIKITGYNGPAGYVRIPSKLDGLPVTSIEYGAFEQKGLTIVDIPDGITSIGMNAFSRNELTKVYIPYSVITIDIQAFHQNFLTEVTIPGIVKCISINAFAYNELTEINIPNSDSNTLIMEKAFWSNMEVTSITIGANVRLMDGSFAGAGNFEKAYDGKAGTYTRPNTSSSEWTRC